MSKTKNIYSTVRSVKFVLKPNIKQREILESFFGLTRTIYNISLHNIKNSKFGTYEIQNGKNKGNIVPRIPTEFDLNNSIPKLKEEHSFLSLLPATYAQSVMKNLSRGFNNFYRTFNYPKFKAKKNSIQSFNCYAGAKIEGDYIILIKPRCSDYTKDDLKIRFKRHKIKYNFDRVTGFTISKENNKYFISFTFRCNIESKETSGAVGIDLGIKDFAICSDGVIFENKRFLEKSLRKLKISQRKLSKKQKGSNNGEKQRLKVSKLHKKVKNQRNDYQHKVSRELADKYRTICLETLKVKNMVKNKKLAKAISDVSWSSFIEKLSYKVAENQGCLIKIDTYYPSSKTCSNCGCVKETLSLSERTYHCNECGFEIDRDLNASINILNLGLKNIVATVTTTGTTLKN
ncbi:RNA-guided endonuclease InsQ/TnpB family protein [Campylobacter jejuni]|uniref:RNA-guided endonuclease InsQ/TnpB family protein n=3 Tax=Campylobacter jejuni TaxID=197 RepID=UPI000F807660|nr:RNA-guided endonuclease TnpB family protein [Campylobacter jejuni]RTH91811.1 transposase [Campylobacter jejuni]